MSEYSGPYGFIEDEELRRLEEDTDILLIYDDDEESDCKTDGAADARRVMERMTMFLRRMLAEIPDEEFLDFYDDFVFLASMSAYDICLAFCKNPGVEKRVEAIAEKLEASGKRDLAMELMDIWGEWRRVCRVWDCSSDERDRWCWMRIQNGIGW